MITLSSVIPWLACGTFPFAHMKKFIISAIVLASAALSAASPLTSTAKRWLPSQSQQVIAVDQAALRNSELAGSMREQFSPQDLKLVAQDLKQVGVDLETEVSTLTFVTVRAKAGDLRSLLIAQGNFANKAAVLKKNKTAFRIYRKRTIYSLKNGADLVLADTNTAIIGDSTAVRMSIDADADSSKSANSRKDLLDMMAAVDSGQVWSILDAEGSRYMLRNSLGKASELADFDAIRNRILGTHYTADLAKNLRLNMSLITSDSVTAATLASLLKAGIVLKKLNAAADEKLALESLLVQTDAARVNVRMQMESERAQRLMNSDLFAGLMQ